MAAPKKKSTVRPARKAASAKPARATSRKPAARKPAPKVRKPTTAKSSKPAKLAPAPRARAIGPLPASLIAAVKALDEKKAEQIRVIELGPLSSVADYFVLATGTSDPHLRALRIELDRALEASGSRVRGIEAQRESGWTVVDAFDIVFHLFRPDQRAAFRLETLWKDGVDVPVAGILAS